MAIFVFLYLSLQYFDKVKDQYDSDDEGEGEGFVCSILGDDMCYGYKNHHFHFNVFMWDLFQCVWVSFYVLFKHFKFLKD